MLLNVSYEEGYNNKEPSCHHSPSLSPSHSALTPQCGISLAVPASKSYRPRFVRRYYRVLYNLMITLKNSSKTGLFVTGFSSVDEWPIDRAWQVVKDQDRYQLI